MNCPYCNQPMEKGQLKSRGGVFFLPEGESLPLLYTEWQMEKHGAVPLPPGVNVLRPEYPEAWICRNCRKIQIEY